jgi:3-hydroxyisobutyrate dehydrogenase-like beta-hydroxyacid dehydrogenase
VTRVAFLGLGRMGRPMAERLLDVADPLIVWNRSAAKVAAFVDARPAARSASTPREAAAGADVVVSMVADDAAAEAVHLGEAGALTADPPAAVVIESGTLAPATVRRLADAARASGTAFLDVPVSGSVDAAKAGSLLLLAGGDADALADAEPVLARLGRRTVHMGGSGSGSLAKLLVNGVLHALNQAVGEALAVADASGLARDDLYDVLSDSAVGAPMLGYRRAQYLTDDAPVAFALSLAAKDVGLLIDEADAAGAAAPQARLNLAALRRAAEDGYGDEDMAALAAWLRAHPSAAGELR